MTPVVDHNSQMTPHENHRLKSQIPSNTSVESDDLMAEDTPMTVYEHVLENHRSETITHASVVDSVLLTGMSPENKDSMLAELSYEVDLTEEVVKRTASKYRLQVDEGKGAHKIALTTPKMTTSQMLTYRGGLEAAVCQGPGIYYVGIIDVLQQWNIWKKLERVIKTLFLRKDPRGISAVNPQAYQFRFMEKMYEITVS